MLFGVQRIVFWTPLITAQSPNLIMKVRELKKGMLLQPIEPWVASLRKYSSEIEHRLLFSHSTIASLGDWGDLSPDTPIIYLGDDIEKRRPRPYRRRPNSRRPSKFQRIRRVLVNGTIAIVTGHDFKHLQPHPDFVNCRTFDYL
jgi:hypothetical protein